MVNGLPVAYTDRLVYLGVTIDSKLTWSANTKQKVTKAKQAIGCITRALNKKIPLVLLRRLVMCKVLPVYMYGMAVTYPRNKVDRTSLERLNRYVARVCANDYVSPYAEVLERLGMQPIYQAVLYQRIQLAQKYARGKRYLPPNTILSNQNRRLRSHGFTLAPQVKTGLLYRDSALELLINAWNRLPEEIVDGNAGGVKRRLINNEYNDASWEVFTDLRATLLIL